MFLTTMNVGLHLVVLLDSVNIYRKYQYCKYMKPYYKVLDQIHFYQEVGLDVFESLTQEC